MLQTILVRCEKTAREKGYLARALESQDRAEAAQHQQQEDAGEEEELAADTNNADADMDEPNHEEMVSMVGVLLQLGLTKYEVHEVISEIYSPPRVTTAAAKHASIGFTAGAAYDLQVNSSTGESWDFSLAAHRAKCRREVAEQKPVLVVSSPPCTPSFAVGALR
jgi:hypothetical protein